MPERARAAEAGAGTGVLSLYMAMAGASRVVGSDIDPAALAAARHNARVNGIPNVEFVEGSLLEPIPGPLDLAVALLPHKPAPRPFNPRYYGGADGTDLLLPVIRQARERLVAGGSLYLYLNGIANPRRVLAAFGDGFDVALRGEKKRHFTREEFDGLTPGMFDYLRGQRERGEAEFDEDTDGLYFMARIYQGRRR